MPPHLPQRMAEFRNRYEHHLLLRIEDQDIAQVESYLQEYFKIHSTGNYFLCNEEEGRKAFYTDLPLQEQLYVTVMYIAGRSKTLWRSILP